VLLAIGVPVEVAHGSLRLSLSGENTPAQVAHIAETVPRVVAYLRSISPVWEQMQNEKA
jgi:cysteine desulfurase